MANRDSAPFKRLVSVLALFLALGVVAVPASAGVFRASVKVVKHAPKAAYKLVKGAAKAVFTAAY